MRLVAGVALVVGTLGLHAAQPAPLVEVAEGVEIPESARAELLGNLRGGKKNIVAVRFVEADFFGVGFPLAMVFERGQQPAKGSLCRGVVSIYAAAEDKKRPGLWHLMPEKPQPYVVLKPNAGDPCAPAAIPLQLPIAPATLSDRDIRAIVVAVLAAPPRMEEPSPSGEPPPRITSVYEIEIVGEFVAAKTVDGWGRQNGMLLRRNGTRWVDFPR